MTRAVLDAKLTPKQKIDLLASFFISSGIAVNSVKRNQEYGTTDYCLTLTGGESVLVHAVIKNISGAGWSWKPFIKRIQVKSFADKKLPPNSKTEITLLGGFAQVDDQFVYAAWNIFAYMTQNTVRSCYIDVDNLMDALERGFFTTLYAENRVYLSDNKHMNDLITTYIRHNAITII